MNQSQLSVAKLDLQERAEALGVAAGKHLQACHMASCRKLLVKMSVSSWDLSVKIMEGLFDSWELKLKIESDTQGSSVQKLGSKACWICCYYYRVWGLIPGFL